MLEVISCRSPEGKQKLFNGFDPQDATWVVSDLQSKWHLQQELIARQGVLEQAGVRRAAELWSHFAFQLEPRLRVLSPELAQTLFWNWIEPLGLPWARSPQAVPVLLSQMQMWMSVLAAPDHREVMGEWFASNRESVVRWGHWFELCSEVWRRCREERLVLAPWLPALLLSRDLSELHWERDLTFDLGPQMSLVEGQLIKELARTGKFAVRLIFPEAPWVSLMRNALRPYDDLLSEPYRGDPGWQPSVKESFTFGRFSTKLAEVKDAVARVRGWLEGGVNPARIAVVAPDVEEYWPALQLYFEQEGVPVAKPLTARLGGYLDMARWMSSLRTALAKISSADLEVHLFSLMEKPLLSFDDFRVLFTNVYDERDLLRASELFSGARAPSDAVADTFANFLAWALRLWPGETPGRALMAALQSATQEVPQHIKLRPKEWLSYLEGLLCRRELRLQAQPANGVWCVSLSSADWLPVTHGLFLGLDESALRSIENSPVSAGEAQKVYTDTGFAVSSLDHQEREFELLWFLHREWRDLRLCFAETDFAGRALTPSKLWVWAAYANGRLKGKAGAPQPTRWDEIQRQDLTSLREARGWSEKRESELREGLERDRTGESSSWRPSVGERLSASSLERYLQCPFVFAAQRKFKLSDAAALDLDMDRRMRGSLLHAVADLLLRDRPPRLEWRDDELCGLIEEARARENLKLGDERLWPAIRNQHLRLARFFLEFERAWRGRFPETVTVGRELSFECFWNLDASRPSADPGPVILSGRLDRVDRDANGALALIDYKASAGGLRNWKSWLANNELQLGLYSLLLETGMTGVAAGKVVAANYYVIKDRDRRKGFHLRDSDSDLFCAQDKHANFIDEKEKEAFFIELGGTITSVIKDIAAGRLNPGPADKKICLDCSWRRLCRAPHLN